MDAQLLEEISLLHNQVCHALGDPTRIAIFYVLTARAQCVNDIAAELELPQPTISRHLKILRDRSLVSTERRGTTVYYSIADPRLIHALDLLRAILRDRLAQQLNAFSPDS